MYRGRLAKNYVNIQEIDKVYFFQIACQNLIILEINPVDVVAIGLTTQRGTTVLWDKATGEPLYNAISWSDARCTDVLKGLLGKVKGNLNYLKSVCGLPLSTCFSALKIKWLEENVPSVQQSVAKKNCCFGTLDSWILWVSFLFLLL